MKVKERECARELGCMANRQSPKSCLEVHGIIEQFQLERAFKIIESDC